MSGCTAERGGSRQGAAREPPWSRHGTELHCFIVYNIIEVTSGSAVGKSFNQGDISFETMFRGIIARHPVGFIGRAVNSRSLVRYNQGIKLSARRLQSTVVDGEKQQRVKKQSSVLSLVLASFILGATTAFLFPLSDIAKLVVLETLPTDEEGVERYKEKLEVKLTEIPLYKQLQSDPQWRSVRAWNYMDSNTLNETMTSGTLSVPGGFAIKPVLFVNSTTRETVTIFHVGERMCGYPFLVHGGILATILDETLKRSSSFLFGIDPASEYTPDKVKTNRIELQYRFPTLANNFLVVKARCVDGHVEGDIETVQGRLLVQGVGHFSQRTSVETNSKPAKKRWFFF